MTADAAILELPKIPLQAKELLPEYSGIYYVLDEANIIWYIGQAKNIRKRWQGKSHHRFEQLEAQKKNYFTIYYEKFSEFQLNNVESQRINKYLPHLNASPVKTKNVRPTETLLRETLAAIAPFAFILGVEPPRQEIASQMNNTQVKSSAKDSHLSIIHICLDDVALNAIYQPESIEEKTAIEQKPFSSRKAYSSRWKSVQLGYNMMLRLTVCGYAIEVTPWSYWDQNNEAEGLREYIQTTLAQESIKALTPESLHKIQQQADKGKNYAYFLQRSNAYTFDLIKLLFNDTIDKEKIKEDLSKISEDYKVRKRGVGSRPKSIGIEELIINKGIDLSKYLTKDVKLLSRDRIGLYINSFVISDHKQKFPITNLAYGILDNKEVRTISYQLDRLYFLAGVDIKAWLLVEEYLKEFAKPATELMNGEGYVEKFYISALKYIVPAKVNIELEDIGYSAWIPFGPSEEFDTFELAKEEIHRRLINSDLPKLKVTFRRETIRK